MGNVRARMEARVKERGGGGESAGTSLSLRAIPGREECDCQGLRESAQTFGVILQIFVDVPPIKTYPLRVNIFPLNLLSTVAHNIRFLNEIQLRLEFIGAKLSMPMLVA